MKRTLAILTLLCCVVGASQPATAAGLEKKNKAIARRVFEEMFTQGRFQVADEIYAKDFVNHGLHRNIGLKEDQDAAREWKLAIPDLKMTVLQEIAEGDLVTVLWTTSGTHTGQGFGLPATGNKIEGRGITIWRIVKGRITEEWSEFDELGFMKQLGYSPGARP